MASARREAALVEGPTVRRALHELLVPSIPLKLKSGVDTGWNDTLFLIPGGRPLFVEFKWPGYTPDPKQVYKHELLESLGYDCQTHDNVEEALEAIRIACARAKG